MKTCEVNMFWKVGDFTCSGLNAGGKSVKSRFPNGVTLFLQVVTKRPPSHAEVENYGFKMFIFIMFILALIMIPIAIVWETRKSYIKSTDAYKGLAKFVFKSFGYKI